MKKLFTLAVIAAATIFSANAQTSFGVKAGPNFAYTQSKVSVVNLTASSDIKVGFYAGFFADIEVSEKFHVQPELVFSAEGSKEEGFEAINVNYIQLPVIVKFYIGDKFNIQAGPQVSLLISVEDFEGNLGDAFNTFNFGVSTGLGFDISDKFSVNTRADMMITDLDKVDGVKSRQHSFKIGGAFKFN